MWCSAAGSTWAAGTATRGASPGTSPTSWRDLPVAVFALGPVDDVPEHRRGAEKQFRAAVQKLPFEPVATALFGGAVDPAQAAISLQPHAGRRRARLGPDPRVGAASRRSASARSRRGGRCLAPRGTQHRELVGDLEVVRAEAEHLGRPAAAASGRPPLAGRLEHASTEEDALEVGRGHLVAERRCVQLAELRDREGLGCEREAEVGVGELRAQALSGGEGERSVVERRRREIVDRVPPGVRPARPGRCRCGSARDRRSRPARCGGRPGSRAARGARARGRRPSLRDAAGSSARTSHARGALPAAPIARRTGRGPGARAAPAALRAGSGAPLRRSRAYGW